MWYKITVFTFHHFRSSEKAKDIPTLWCLTVLYTHQSLIWRYNILQDIITCKIGDIRIQQNLAIWKEFATTSTFCKWLGANNVFFLMECTIGNTVHFSLKWKKKKPKKPTQIVGTKYFLENCSSYLADFLPWPLVQNRKVWFDCLGV